MSLTKNSPSFDRMMEEARLQEECSYERYAEELYLNRQKGKMPPKEETQPKEDIFGMMGRIFNPNK